MKLNKSVSITLAVAFIATVASGWVTLADQVIKRATNADRSFSFPRIKDHGKVVRSPDAADQPHDGSKICVDVTAGGAPDKINPAIEKVARASPLFNLWTRTIAEFFDFRVT